MNDHPSVILLRPFFLSLLLLFPAATASAESMFSLGLGFDYVSGDYGTGIDADSYSTSLLLEYYPTGKLDFALTIPFIYQSGGTTTTSRGIRFRTDGSGGMTGPGMGPGGGGGDPDGLPESDKSRSGLGDLLFSAGYLLLPETAGRPQVRATGFIKFPTADEGRQLGTGEYDFGAGLAASKWLGRFFLFGQGEAVFQGDNDRLGLRDFQTYEGGGGYQVSDHLLSAVSIWGATSPAAGSPAQLEARVELNYLLSGNRSISGYTLIGLTDSSPDFGIGGSIFFSF